MREEGAVFFGEGVSRFQHDAPVSHGRGRLGKVWPIRINSVLLLGFLVVLVFRPAPDDPLEQRFGCAVRRWGILRLNARGKSKQSEPDQGGGYATRPQTRHYRSPPLRLPSRAHGFAVFYALECSWPGWRSYVCVFILARVVLLDQILRWAYLPGDHHRKLFVLTVDCGHWSHNHAAADATAKLAVPRQRTNRGLFRPSSDVF
jgi:hypothetical protein